LQLIDACRFFVTLHVFLHCRPAACFGHSFTQFFTPTATSLLQSLGHLASAPRAPTRPSSAKATLIESMRFTFTFLRQPEWLDAFYSRAVVAVYR
jgi:hypothetical protein